MSAINNLKGTVVKDGKIVYSEKLKDKLFFLVIMMYEPIYEGSNGKYWQHSSQIHVQSVISTGERVEYKNGVISM